MGNVFGYRMKLLFAMLMIVALVLIGCVNTDQAKIMVKQIIPIGPGTFIEATVPLNTNLSSYTLNDKSGANTITENSEFALPAVIHSPSNKGISNASLRLSYSSDYFDYLYIYFSDGKPLARITNDTYYLNDQFNPSTDTTVFLIGHAKEIPGLRYAGAVYSIELLGTSSEVITSVNDTIQINRKT